MNFRKVIHLITSDIARNTAELAFESLDHGGLQKRWLTRTRVLNNLV